MRGRRGALAGMAAALLLLSSPLPAAAPPAIAVDDAPRRIVSANLCADRLVLALADRDRVVSVSPFAADPEVSTVAAQAAGIAVNRGGVEDIVAFKPDLVVLGTFNAPATARMLRGLGIAVHVVAEADSVAAVETVIADLAQALGRPGRGAAMIGALRAGFAGLPRHHLPPRAVVYQAGGWSVGRGTLTDDLFGRAGIVNAAAAAGLTGFGAFPLENLAAAAPDLIVVERMGEEAPSLAGALLRHPVLTATGARVVAVPMRLWACPDPALLEATRLISAAAR